MKLTPGAMIRSLCALLLATAASAFPFSATLDASTAHHVYAGHGALSAGASSRLLWDYMEPQRSEVLDYLFKPQFGAALSMLKVEVGGDAQSTDGTEPSHRHTRSDLSCTRGYELFLIEEAKKRQPGILTYGLVWGTPAWVGNGTYYSQDGVDYLVDWVRCIKQATTASVTLDYLGLWSEWAPCPLPALARISLSTHPSARCSPHPHCRRKAAALCRLCSNTARFPERCRLCRHEADCHGRPV